MDESDQPATLFPASTGEDDAASDTMAQKARATLRELEHQLAEVQAAVRRLEEGTYGHCEVCNGLIEESRLANDPAARRCGTHAESDTAQSLL